MNDSYSSKNVENQLSQLGEAGPSVPVGIFSTDEAGCILHANQSFHTLLGLDPERATGKTLASLLGGKEGEAFAVKWAKVLQSDESFEHEFLVSLPKSGRRYLRVEANPVEGRGDVVREGTLIDVSDESHLLERLARERDLLQESLDSLTDAVVIKDRQGRFLRWNTVADASMRKLCPHLDTIQGVTDFDLFDEATAKRYRKNEKAILNSGEPALNHEEKSVTMDGKPTFWLLSYTPLKDTHGDVIGIVAVGRDVTEARLAEQHLESTNRLLEANRSFADLLQNADSLDLALEQINNTLRQDLPLGQLHLDLDAATRDELNQFPLSASLRSGRRILGRLALEATDPKAASTALPSIDAERVLKEFFRDLVSQFEARLARDELQRTERRYRDTFSAISDAILVIDETADRIVYCNSAAGRLFGTTVSQLQQADLADDALADTALVRAINSEKRRDLFRLERDGGDTIDVEVRSRSLPRTSEGHRLIVLRDVTLQREAQVWRERLERVFDAAPELFCLVDHDDRILLANQNYAEYQGFSIAQVIGKHTREVVGDDLYDRVVRDRHEEARQGKNVFLEAWVEFTNRGRRYIEVSYAPASDTETGKGAVVVIIRDLTDQQIGREELRRAQEEAVSADRAKSEFLAHMSHDIRTPLNGIIGCAELLGSVRTLDQVEQLREIISASGHVLLNLINQVLDLSKIESGHLVLDPAEFAINDLLDQLRSEFSLRAKARDVKLSVTLASDVPSVVFADRERIAQVLRNLLDNALKFTDDGTVDLAVSMATPNRSTGDNDREHHFLECRVVDTGIGMTTEQVSRIFQPFTQATESIREQFGGTGLGLVICERLAKALGGSIDVVSAPGKGSTFVFRALVEAHVPSGSTPPPFRFSPKGTNRKSFAERYPLDILVVDDVAPNRTVLLSMLQLLGFEAESVSDGESAVNLFQRKDFDVILMDIRMPVMDGYATTAAIRALEAKRSTVATQIIAVTASAMKEDRERCLASGMDDHLAKPVELVGLQDMLVSAHRTLQKQATR